MSTNDNNDEFLFNIDDEDFNFGEDEGDGKAEPDPVPEVLFVDFAHVSFSFRKSIKRMLLGCSFRNGRGSFPSL